VWRAAVQTKKKRIKALLSGRDKSESTTSTLPLPSSRNPSSNRVHVAHRERFAIRFRQHHFNQAGVAGIVFIQQRANATERR